MHGFQGSHFYIHYSVLSYSKGTINAFLRPLVSYWSSKGTVFSFILTAATSALYNLPERLLLQTPALDTRLYLLGFQRLKLLPR